MQEPIFDNRRRGLHRNLAVLLLLAGATAPYGAGLLALALAPNLEQGMLGSAVAALSVLLSMGLTWVLQDRAGLVGNRGLKRELRQRLEEARGEFVGFSPGAELRSWEGETDQDVGFLSWEGDTLVYQGDRFSWSLRREQIDAVQPVGVAAQQTPAVGPVRVAVYWHGPRDPGRVLTLASREADTVSRAARRTQDLGRRLNQWWQEGGGELEPAPEAMLGTVFGPPPTDDREAALLDRPAPGSCLSALSLAVISVSLIWYRAGDLIQEGLYNRAILWAGLILMAGIVFTAHFLTYLQVQQARGRGRGGDKPAGSGSG